MKIAKNKSNPTFNARLILRGNVKSLPIKQKGYLKTVASQIGMPPYDKIDMFAHFPRDGKEYSLIDIGGFINQTLRAVHTSYLGENVYDGVVNGLKLIIEKLYNNEIINQLSKTKDKNSYKELKSFITRNGIELQRSEERPRIVSNRLVIDGAIDSLSNEEIENLTKIANMVSINNHDKFYMFLRQEHIKEKPIINMAGYINGYLKTTIADYQNGNAYAGAREGLVFIIEKLFGEQIQNSAKRYLPSYKLDKINKFLNQEQINLRV